jgi:hypothetical protein
MEPDNTTPWQRFTDPERKRQFARLVHERPRTIEAAHEAAMRVFPLPGDEILATKARTDWLNDPIVLEELDRLSKSQDYGELPSRAQQARDIYNLAQDHTKPIDDRIKAHKLYAEIMGFVQKPGNAGQGGGNTYIDNRRVILLPQEPASIDEWEAEAKAHQAKLVSNASR